LTGCLIKGPREEADVWNQLTTPNGESSHIEKQAERLAQLEVEQAMEIFGPVPNGTHTHNCIQTIDGIRTD